MRWRASRGEKPSTAGKVVERFSTPLIFEPGTSWQYGASIDWAGLAVERVNPGETLETYFQQHILRPLGITDFTFWPDKREDMKSRRAMMSLRAEDGSGETRPTKWSHNVGATTCLGGQGGYATARDYFKVVQAVLADDEKLLKKESLAELFTPQLGRESRAMLERQCFNTAEIPGRTFSHNTPSAGGKSYGLGGLLSLDEYPGWRGKNTLAWGGLPNLLWVSLVSGNCDGRFANSWL